MGDDARRTNIKTTKTRKENALEHNGVKRLKKSVHSTERNKLKDIQERKETQKIPRQNYVIFWPSTQPKNAIPRWYTGRKWHIPMASNRKRSRGRIKAYEMGQGEGPIVPLQWCTGRE